MNITVQQAREMFESKMRWVEQQTGRDIKTSLMMAGGPDHADVVYEQMFACYLAGVEAGMKHNAIC
jgi:hypothetical protein